MDETSACSEAESTDPTLKLSDLFGVPTPEQLKSYRDSVRNEMKATGVRLDSLEADFTSKEPPDYPTPEQFRSFQARLTLEISAKRMENLLDDECIFRFGGFDWVRDGKFLKVYLHPRIRPTGPGLVLKLCSDDMCEIESNELGHTDMVRMLEALKVEIEKLTMYKNDQTAS